MSHYIVYNSIVYDKKIIISYYVIQNKTNLLCALDLC